MILYATLKQKNASNLRLPLPASDASWGALTIRRWGRWWCKWPCCPWAPGNFVHGNFPKNQGLLSLTIKDITMIHLYLKKPFSNHRFGWRHALNTEIPHLVEVDVFTIPKKNSDYSLKDLVTTSSLKEIHLKIQHQPPSLRAKNNYIAPSSTISGSILPYHLAPRSHQSFSRTPGKFVYIPSKVM